MVQSGKDRSGVAFRADLAGLSKSSALYGGIEGFVEPIFSLPRISCELVTERGVVASISKLGLRHIIEAEREKLRVGVSVKNDYAISLFHLGEGWKDLSIDRVIESVASIAALSQNDSGAHVFSRSGLGILDFFKKGAFGTVPGRKGTGRRSASGNVGTSSEDEKTSLSCQAVLTSVDAEILSYGLYESSVRFFEKGLIDSAVIALSIIPWLGVKQSEALCSLSICAAKQGRCGEALMFAIASLSFPNKTARAFCVAGYCELRAGRLKEAKSFLASALRLARGRSFSRVDARCAQRLLLSMYFG